MTDSRHFERVAAAYDRGRRPRPTTGGAARQPSSSGFHRVDVPAVLPRLHAAPQRGGRLALWWTGPVKIRCSACEILRRAAGEAARR